MKFRDVLNEEVITLKPSDIDKKQKEIALMFIDEKSLKITEFKNTITMFGKLKKGVFLGKFGFKAILQSELLDVSMKKDQVFINFTKKAKK